jgi:lipopolysaccharide/colanic/teichoic acid biosynthesis glycosyltransferase
MIVKRAFDILAASLGLLVCSPLLLAVMFAITAVRLQIEQIQLVANIV